MDTLQRHSRRYLFGRNTIPYPQSAKRLPAIYIFIPYLIYLLYSFIIRLYLKEENPIASWGHSFLGQVYIALPLGLLSFIAYPPLATEYLLMPYNALLVIAFFSFIWINDTGAYIVGCTIGKHRLFERISPKNHGKDFSGGLAFSLLLGWVWSTQCSFLNMGQWIGLSAVVSIFSTWGDLCESLLKRTLNVKDSGNILPGHGGLLDRLDSVFLRFSGNGHLPLSTYFLTAREISYKKSREFPGFFCIPELRLQTQQKQVFLASVPSFLPNTFTTVR